MTTAFTTDATTSEEDPDTSAAWEADDTEEAEAEAPEAEAEADDDAEDGEPKKRGVRQRLAEAEADRDYLRETLTATNELLFRIAAERAGVTPELMTSRGLEPGDFTSGGANVVNMDELVAAMEREKGTLGLPSKPRPNPVAGRTSSEGTSPVASFAEVLKAHATRANG